MLGPKGKVLAEDSAQSSGGGFGVGEFSTHVRFADPPRAGTRVTVQVFGDNPGLPDQGPSPGFDLREVEVIVFPQMQGWLIYRVESGDTLTAIVRKVKAFTKVTVRQIVAANPKARRPRRDQSRPAAADSDPALTSPADSRKSANSPSGSYLRASWWLRN